MLNIVAVLFSFFLSKKPPKLAIWFENLDFSVVEVNPM